MFSPSTRWWHLRTDERRIISVQDGACLDAVGTGVGDRVRLLTCSAGSQTQRLGGDLEVIWLRSWTSLSPSHVAREPT